MSEPPKCCHGGNQSNFEFKKLFPDLPKCEITDEQNTNLGNEMISAIPEDGFNTAVPALFTFIGQFIDHDITFNLTEDFTKEPGHINTRTPYLELDSVYGKGPCNNPELYNETGTHLLWDEDNCDLIRDDSGVAIIGDPRNDENLIIASLQLLFIRFHNKVVTEFIDKNDTNEVAFFKARKVVIQYYQGMILNDYLPRIITESVFNDIRDNGNRFYKPHGKLWFPHEFSIAAYRFGHATILEEYKINDTMTATLEELFTLRGEKIDWKCLTDINKCVTPQYSRKITPFLTTTLGNIPGDPPPPLTVNSLTVRNLFRSSQFELSSGQNYAEALQCDPIELDKYPFLEENNISDCVPLWFYILAEAEIQEDGKKLGCVGSRLIGEVIIQIMKESPHSYFSKHTCIDNLKCCKQASIANIINYVENNNSCP